MNRVTVVGILSCAGIMCVAGCGGGGANTTSPFATSSGSGGASGNAVARATTTTAPPSLPGGRPLSATAGANPAPTLTGEAPTLTVTATPGAAGGSVTITLTGTGFVAASQVLWNNGILKTTYVSATSLTAVIPASDLASAGTFNVSVKNPAPGGGTSGHLIFTVENPAPTVSGETPTFTLTTAPGAAGGSVTITLTGTGFVSTSQVFYNTGVLKTTYVSATSLTAVIPASDLASAGTFNISVKSPAPGGGTSAAVVFEVINSDPTLSSINLTSAVAGSSAVTVKATGTGFVKTSSATWDGNPLVTADASATSLSFVIPKTDLAAVGVHKITVMNPAPGGGTSTPFAFTVNNPDPTLSSLNPPSVTAVAVGVDTTPTISAKGTNFVWNVQALWDGTALATTFVSATSLTFVIPASDLASAGTHKITIKNPAPGGGASSVLTYTVNNPAPTLSSISSTSVQAGSSALTVTATGSGFVAASTALWDGAALATTFVSATSLTFVIPQSKLATVGTHTITIKSPAPGGGTSGSPSAMIRYTVSASPCEGAWAGVYTMNDGRYGTEKVVIDPTGRVTGSLAYSGGSSAITGSVSASGQASFIIGTGGFDTGLTILNAKTHVLTVALTNSGGQTVNLTLQPAGTASPFTGSWSGTFSASDGSSGTAKFGIVTLGVLTASEMTLVGSNSGKTTTLAGVVDALGNVNVTSTNSSGSAPVSGTASLNSATHVLTMKLRKSSGMSAPIDVDVILKKQ